MERKPAEPGGGGEAGRVDETARERGERDVDVLDRNLSELLQETRVAITGVQVLFGFLLSLAFTQRFGRLDGIDRGVYVLALLSTAGATVALIAPVAYHRILFRRHRKRQLVEFADRALLLGLALLSVGISSALFPVLDVVVDRPFAIAASSVLFLAAVGFWWVFPLRSREDPG